MPEWLGTEQDRLRPATLGLDSSFLQPVSLNIRYDLGGTQHINVSQLAIFQRNEQDGTWQALPTTLDHDLKEATAQISTAGMYTLQGPRLCPQDTDEPNDWYDLPTLLVGGQSPVYGVFDTFEDEDWYAFEATQNGLYTITTTNLGLYVDTLIELYDQAGTVLLASDDPGGGATTPISWRAPAGGYYRIRIANSGVGLPGCGARYALEFEQEVSVFLPLLQ